jgi:acyl-CoA dehydrogenase
MRWLGIASRAFDMMCTRANERVITPEGETLADRQVIQHWAAELDAEIRGARLQTLHAAWMIDTVGAKAARDEISAIKFSVANTMLHAVDTAIQVHGALGVTDDTILSYWYRHERAARIYDGADEVHKTSLGRGSCAATPESGRVPECTTTTTPEPTPATARPMPAAPTYGPA